MSDKEEILNKVATRLMQEWNLNKFKLSHKRLFEVIMDSMDSYNHSQKQTIDKLTKEVEGLKEKLQLERVVNVENKNQNNVISNWLVDYKEENTKLKEQLRKSNNNE